MPKKFDSCIKKGGSVRTKDLGHDKYIHVCYPKDGGPAIAGEVKTKEKPQK